MPLTIAIAGAIGATATVVWLAQGSALRDAVSHSRSVVPLLTLLPLLTMANILLRWLRFHFLLRQLGYFLPAKASAKLYWSTIAANVTPFYVGELLRGLFVHRKYRMPLRTVVSLWLYERLSDAIVIAAFWVAVSGRPAVTLGFVVALALLIALGRQWRPSAGRIEASHSLLAGRTSAISLASSAMAWALPAFGLWCTLLALNGSAPASAAIEAFARGTLIGGLTGVPAGAGVTGSSTIMTLQAHAVPQSVAILSVLIFRWTTTWFAVSLGVVGILLWHRDLRQWVTKTPPVDQGHFDTLAAGYSGQLPLHLQQRLIGRKVDVMARELACRGRPAELHGLDIGCGHGWYSAEMARRGYRMTGCDLAVEQVRQAQTQAAQAANGGQYGVASATDLPFPSETFDFAYSINVFHHITKSGGQEHAFAEVLRVLKPAGVFFLQEINTENPLFRLYMGYVFPLIRDIDEGTERWIRPRELPEVAGGSWVPDVDYFTFLPDFTPQVVTRLLAGVEERLERSHMRPYSAHYVAKLVRI